ncbi:MAG: 1-acyl-sn-glycerol-3-phosphate acyltransferase [Chloroflexota bacterium]
MGRLQTGIFPRYSYPVGLAAGFVFDFLFLHTRSFRADARACIARLKPPLRVHGRENIPLSGPCLITFNHYFRPRFHAWWLALAIAAVVPVEMHWVMTGELTFPSKWYAFLGKPVSRMVLRRLAKIYGFTTMPPMPPRPKDVEARARSVRRVLEYLRAHPNAILGLSPEGGDDQNGRLTWPPPGAGRFLHLLSEAGFSILPVGVYEQAGEFCLRFGAAYRLQVPRRAGADERDRAAAEIVMLNIARQLPPRLRGEFDISSNGSF